MTESFSYPLLKSNPSCILSSEIFSHGCWCAKLDPSNQEDFYNLGGNHAIDEIDQLCKKWFYNRRCNDRIENGSCNDIEDTSFHYYQVNHDTNLGVFTCSEQDVNTNRQLDNCEFDSCNIDLFYALNIYEKINEMSTNFTSSFVSHNQMTSITGNNLCQIDTTNSNNSKSNNKICTGIVPDLVIVDKPVCYCNDGVPRDCENDNPIARKKRDTVPEQKESCESCNPGYQLVGELCQKINHCYCDDGAPISSDLCPVDNTEYCEICHLGYSLSESNTCENNQCTCENGTPAMNLDCDLDGSEA